MVRIIKLQFLLVIALEIPCSLLGRTHPSVESLAMHYIERAANSYVEKHEGQFPTNWNQIGEFLDVDRINRQTLAKSSAFPLQEHYVFVQDKISIPQMENGEVFLIRTTSLQNESRGEGRYLISRIGDHFVSIWLAETNVQKMLADAGVRELPKPEPFSPPSNQIPPAGISQSRQEPHPIAPVVASNTSPDLQGTASVPDRNITPEPLPTGEPNTNSVPARSMEMPRLKWLLVGIVVVLGGGLAFQLLRQKKS